MLRRPAAVALVCAAVLPGCASREPGDEEQVRTLLNDFARATAAKDYQRLCDEIFARELLDGITAIGLPCEVAMRNSLGDVRNPRLTVGTVEISGSKASAEVRSSAEGQEPSRDTVRLVKGKDGWKVSSLGEAPAAAARPTPRR